MDDIEVQPYKSLRTAIYEVMAAQRPKAVAGGEVWQTASGKYGARNKQGTVDYFDSEDNAKAWVSGNYKPAGRVDDPGDTSVKVDLDKDGYERKPETAGKAAQKPNGEPARPAPARPSAASQTQTATGDTQRSAQPQGSQASGEQKPQQPQSSSEKEEHPEIASDDPKTEYDSEIKVDPKATEKAKAKPDIRKANVVAKAIKSGLASGPKNDGESVFGDAAAEQRFIEEMNHAALSALRGKAAFDFEMCSEVFANIGLCYEAKTKKKVSKGIPRKEMPQFSSKVDPSKPDSVAFQALMRGKGYTSPDQVTPQDLESEVNLERQYSQALQDAGYDITDEEINVTSLKPTQGELKGEKIAGMYGTLVAAKSDPENYGKAAARLLDPIYVSDGYVIDGHHRWAAQCAFDIANGSGANATMKVRSITKGGKPVRIEEIIEFSNKFQKDMGLLSQTRGGETIPEKKKTEAKATTTKEGYLMYGFNTKKIDRAVQQLNEASKMRFKKPKIAAPEDSNDDPRFAKAAKPLAPRKSDRFGNPIKKSKGFDASARAMQGNLATADDLLRIVDAKPVGTTFEVYGKKGGAEVSKKVKKMMKYGEVVLMVGDTVVELVKSGTGLQVVDKQSRRIVLDHGNDMIWESADFTDVGWICISE